MTHKKMNVAIAFSLHKQLQVRGMTLADMAEFSGLSKVACARWMRKMNADDSTTRLYISDYALDVRGRPFIPVYRAGSMPDAPRPGQRRTAAERMAALRARRKEGGAA